MKKITMTILAAFMMIAANAQDGLTAPNSSKEKVHHNNDFATFLTDTKADTGDVKDYKAALKFAGLAWPDAKKFSEKKMFVDGWQVANVSEGGSLEWTDLPEDTRLSVVTDGIHYFAVESDYAPMRKGSALSKEQKAQEARIIRAVLASLRSHEQNKELKKSLNIAMDKADKAQNTADAAFGRAKSVDSIFDNWEKRLSTAQGNVKWLAKQVSSNKSTITWVTISLTIACVLLVVLFVSLARKFNKQTKSNSELAQRFEAFTNRNERGPEQD